MKNIVKIIATFEYIINGWNIELVYDDGTIKNITTTFLNSEEPDICNTLSDISFEWHEYNRFDDDDEDDDEDHLDEDYFEDLDDESIVAEPHDIEIAIYKHFNLTDDVEIDFKLSLDS